MFDIAIVGNGVAGSFLASKIDPSYKVLIIERNRKIIPKDSGIVSKNFIDIFGSVSKHLIKHEINVMECVSASGSIYPLRHEEPFAYILKRKRFSRYMRKRAAKTSEVVYDSVNGIEFHKDRVDIKTQNSQYSAKMVIGCDGANSVVRNFMGIDPPHVALGIMVKTKQKLEGNINVFFNKYFSPDFFSWIIPQNNEYGLMTSVRPAEYLNYFVKDMYLPPGRMYAYRIPYTYTKSYSDRAILIGDACGQNKPLTGGGIVFSITAAKHAADVINEALKVGKFDGTFLKQYEKKWKKNMAWEIEKQFMLRLIYRHLSNKEIDEMFERFGSILSELNGFDYDKLSGLSKSMSKVRLANFFIRKLHRIL